MQVMALLVIKAHLYGWMHYTWFEQACTHYTASYSTAPVRNYKNPFYWVYYYKEICNIFFIGYFLNKKKIYCTPLYNWIIYCR